MSKFPQDFKWGVATSSYQIEGATNVDGRGESIWDRFCATEGKVANGENGDIACDHYNLFAEDVALMKTLGVSTYRFSLAWPRLFPNGDKQREQRGFDFYNRLIDELIANDITPVITLYHWDLPQMLEDKGGWANREIVYDFAFYAGEAVQAFSDRVKEWITINEPWCVSWLGYMSGVHAPGVKNLDSALASAHHTALAHAEATRVMKAIDPGIKTGLALNMTTYRIEDESDPELAELGDLMDAQLNRWWIDAFLNGRYPKSIAEFHKERLAKIVKPGDLEKLKVQTDYLAVNYYSDSFIGLPRESDGPMSDGGLFPFPHRINGTPPEPHTDMGWAITPVGLEDLLVRIATDWPEIAEIVISENGAAYDDEPNAAGDVEDHRRIDYLVSHIEAASRAIDRGAPLTGYYAWSLMDNFEWAEGYSKRFGIIHVDFTTLKRTIKNSGKTYAAIIAANRLDANSGVK
jgi:beta-glucosidase